MVHRLEIFLPGKDSVKREEENFPKKGGEKNFLGEIFRQSGAVIFFQNFFQRLAILKEDEFLTDLISKGMEFGVT